MMPYIPFLTCDDSKGVVDCRSSRRNVNRRSERNETKTQRGKERDEPVDTEQKMERKKVSEESRANFVSSLQLLKVSKGVQKLNLILESWARGQNYAGQSRDIAKDLLKSALDLQESLGALGRIRKPSGVFVSRLKEQNEGRGIHDLKMSEQNYGKEKQRPSRDCHEELRRVIRESFVRQKLLHNPEEKTRSFGENAESSHASSSQFSTAHGNGSSTTKSSLSSISPPRSSKGPNLIARLMGYESCSSAKMIGDQKPESEKTLSPKRPDFEVDRPKKVKKAAYLSEKGFISVDGMDSESCRFNHFDSKTKGIGSKTCVKATKMEKESKSKRYGDLKVIKVEEKESKYKPHSFTRGRYSGTAGSNQNTRKPEDLDRKKSGNGGRLTSKKPGKSAEGSQKISVMKSSMKQIDPGYSDGDHRSPVRREKPRTEHSADVDGSSDETSVLRKKTGRLIDHFALEDERRDKNDSFIFESIQNNDDESDIPRTLGAHSSIQTLLLNSQAFLDLTQKLFYIKTAIPTCQQEQKTNDFPISYEQLLVDYGIEIMKHKRFHEYGMPVTEFNVLVSLDQLLVDVHNAFQALTSYEKSFDDHDSIVEHIFTILECDLNIKNKMASGIWSLGWIRSFSIEDTEQVVVDVEKLILGGLVEEIIN